MIIIIIKIIMSGVRVVIIIMITLFNDEIQFSIANLILGHQQA